MIKLYNLLLEIQNKQPKAIFLAGSPGSGKSYISKKLIAPSFVIINVDDNYEELLKASSLGIKQKDFSPDQLSQASKLMSQARKTTQDKFKNSLVNKNNLVIDSTAGSFKIIQSKKSELEKLGYECFMVLVYSSPITALERNKQRDRSLMPGIVLRSWRDVNNNINAFKQLFNNNFSILKNENSNNEKFTWDQLNQYFSDSKAIGKPKSREDELKREKEREILKYDVEKILNNLPKFDTLEVTKNKLDNFING